mmetsp:Transcript_103043/g.220389  ORF Transcript_103043/g.220389 Transcript_103043/m.220389 type:complete len:179 (-) Transcript_103043:112-648(-)
MSWAFAKLWGHHLPLLKALSAQALPHISELNRQELSITAWAFATLALRPRPLLNAIAAQSITRLQDFGMLEISNLAWAFAKLAERNEPLWNAIAESSLRRGDITECGSSGEHLIPNGIYSIVWSSWRSTRPRLARALYQREGPQVAMEEPLVRGVMLMDSEWGKQVVGDVRSTAHLEN